MTAAPPAITNFSHNYNNNNYRNNNNRPIRTITTVTEDFDRNIQEVGEDYEQSINIRSVRHISVQTVNTLHRFNMIVDTGAQEHCCTPDFVQLLHNVTKYDSSSTNINLVAAGSHKLNVIGSGYYKTFPDPIYIIKDLETNLFSTTRAQLNMLKFPNGYTLSINNTKTYGLLVNDEGSTQLLIENDLEIDLEKYDLDTYKDIESFQVLKEAYTFKSIHIAAIHSIPYLSKQLPIPELVDFLTISLLFRKEDMISASTNITDFPVNEVQIKKYYKEPQAIRAGSQTMRPITVKRGTKISSPSIHSADHDNQKIGAVVGSDQAGPHKGKVVVIFSDKASGFLHSFYNNLKKDNESSLNIYSSYLREMILALDGNFRQYGHTIDLLKSDSHSIYKSTAVTRLCQSLQIQQQLSPPGEHRLNGLAEIHVKFMKSRVISMYNMAPWLPVAMWIYLWSLAEIQMNLKPSRIVGHQHMTRYQEFTGIKPNFKNLCILPAGIPVSVTQPPCQRTGPFPTQTNAYLAMYLCPDYDTPKCIKVYDPVTKRVSSTNSYIVLSYSEVPSSWKNHNHEDLFEDNIPTQRRQPLPTIPSHPRSNVERNQTFTTSYIPDNNINTSTNNDVSTTTPLQVEGVTPIIPLEGGSNLPSVPTNNAGIGSSITPNIPPTPTITKDVPNTSSTTIPIPSNSSPTSIPKSKPTIKPTVTPTVKPTVLPKTSRPTRNTGTYKQGPARLRWVNRKTRTVEQQAVYKVI